MTGDGIPKFGGAIGGGKVTLRSHRVHEVIGSLAPLERCIDLVRVQDVAFPHFDGVTPRPVVELAGRARQADDFVA